MKIAVTPAINGSVGSVSPQPPNSGSIIFIASGVQNTVRSSILSME